MHTIYMKLDDPTFYKNNDILTLDVPPQIIDGNTLVPLRFVGEALEANVNWDGEHHQAKVSTHDKEVIVNVAPEEIKITIEHW
ncbi:copper amine oxidase N-terminal domain-containing protein [Anaerobacillus sp. HL2]|nr:copper amine oxidase N-terminal domain-containing protein [Anaerobacillus sp. HL2]